MICYEHPLNERIRTLLRLEDLFDKVASFSAKKDAFEHHSALVTLFEILDVTSRAAMNRLLQELEDRSSGRCCAKGPTFDGAPESSLIVYGCLQKMMVCGENWREHADNEC